mmetsp:Transcript_27151/g.65305  ORF Transcript_27151/g.65305 Transcript_27151/m.65305 type:complete len:876 (-) Transcript_27151:84-2711(-)
MTANGYGSGGRSVPLEEVLSTGNPILRTVSQADRAVNGTGGTRMICIATGEDKIGITSGYVGVLVKHAELKILDMAQVSVNGALMLSFMVDVGAGSAMNLMKDLLLQAQLHSMKMEFRFPESVEEASVAQRDGQVIVRVATEGAISLRLLHQFATIFQEHQSNILEIEHEADQHEGCFSSVVQYRIAVTSDLRTDILYAELQKVCLNEDAEVFVRRFDDLCRPKRHSLVVLGASEVVVPYDILHQIMDEAGVAIPDVAGMDPWAGVRRKIQALKGIPDSVLDKVKDRITYTPGARLVCAALKALGFKVALITGSAPARIANKIKHDLEVDYAIAQQIAVDDDGIMTGELGGAIGQWMDEFRKVDLIHLLADREHVAPKDVIVVGDYPVPDGSVELQGPRIYFNAGKHGNMKKVLQLMGFSSRETKELHGMYSRRSGESLVHSTTFPTVPESEYASAADLAPVEPDKNVKKFLLRLMGKENAHGQLSRMLAPVARLDDTRVVTISQSTMHCMCCFCLEFEYRVPEGGDPNFPVKELMFSAKVEGFECEFLQDATVPAALPNVSKCAVTMVSLPSLPTVLMDAVFSVCKQHNVNIDSLERLSADEDQMSALCVSCTLPTEKLESLKATLLRCSQDFHADIALQREDVNRWSRRVIVFDMDSTLIQQEVIDELASYAGVGDRVVEITEAAMRGEIDFHESLRKRVSLLAGAEAKPLFAKVKENLVYTPGAKRLCSTLKKHGFKMAVISGGFTAFASHVKQELGLDYAFANELEIDAQGRLTGRTIGPVVTPDRKRNLLSMISEVEECDLEQVIAVGDGANDIPMLSTAGLGVAFCAKPKVQAAANFRVNHCDLSTLMYLIGLNDSAVKESRARDSPRD